MKPVKTKPTKPSFWAKLAEAVYMLLCLAILVAVFGLIAAT